MKTLKCIFVAIMLASSLVVFSEPNPAAKSTIEAQKKLLKKVKLKMYKLDITDKIGSGCSAEFMVYCKVNEQNHFEIIKMEGEMESLKQNLISLIEKHPIEVSSDLKGKVYVFKLRLLSK